MKYEFKTISSPFHCQWLVIQNTIHVITGHYSSNNSDIQYFSIKELIGFLKTETWAHLIRQKTLKERQIIGNRFGVSPVLHQINHQNGDSTIKQIHLSTQRSIFFLNYPSHDIISIYCIMMRLHGPSLCKHL